jgi:hypothetical protein
MRCLNYIYFVNFMCVAHVERESDKHGVGHLGSEFLNISWFSSIPWLFGRVSVHFPGFRGFRRWDCLSGGTWMANLSLITGLSYTWNTDLVRSSSSTSVSGIRSGSSHTPGTRVRNGSYPYHIGAESATACT